MNLGRRTAEGGCPHMGLGAARLQQIPPVSLRSRVGMTTIVATAAFVEGACVNFRVWVIG